MIREGQVFNGVVIQPNYNIEDFIKYNNGVGLVIKNLYNQRFEYIDNTPVLKELNNFQFTSFLQILYQLVPKKQTIIRRCTLNLYILDLITCYRGWRHFKGFPTRGQRT